MNRIDRMLNNITMYRLVLFALLAISGASFVLSAVGWLGYSPLSLLVSYVTIAAIGAGSHWLLVKAFRSAPSVESWLISGLILFLILRPPQTLADIAVIALATVLVSASKYVLAYRNKHIFNPVAVSLVILGLLGSGAAFWWVGSLVLLPIVLVTGALVIRKIRRFEMVGVFVLSALTTLLISRLGSSDGLTIIGGALASGPLLFFAAFMLTEPQTAPTTRWPRLAYAALVGLLYGLPFSIGPLYSSPELALLIGNLLAFAINHKDRLRLTLASTSQQAPGIYEFTFTPDRPLRFTPGQYLEWTLPHPHADFRGTRRYFTIASSPGESDIKLVARIDPDHASSFKQTLLAMKPGDVIWASQLAGDFTLPRTPKQPVVLIAGGIGITPFRSMIQHQIDTSQPRDTILYYTSLTPDSFAYWQVFNRAAPLGVQSRYVLTGDTVPANWPHHSGFLTAQQITAEVPDYKQRLFYLSGPDAMVTSYKKMLLGAGVPRAHIKTDYFPGF